MLWLRFLFLPFRIGFGAVIFVAIARLFLITSGNIGAKINDKSLELMLRILEIGFHCSKELSENIKDFEGRYVFMTRDRNVVTSVKFRWQKMIISDDPIRRWDIMIIFKDAKVMRDCLKCIVLTGNLDLLNLMLEDKVETAGNLNLAYKFLFLVSSMTRKLPVIYSG